MEYMLMPDGTVKMVPETIGIQEVQDALSDHGGKALYWVFQSYEWMVAYPGDKTGRVTRDVPAVVLLAHTLTQ